MERKRDGLRHITEAFGGLDGLVDAVCEASPQARRHYGLVDQVDALVRASDTDPEPGFMARWLMLCSLPRSNPGQRKEYVRRNGPYTLVMTAGHPHRLPFGNLLRLLVARGEFREGAAAPVVSAGRNPRSTPGSLPVKTWPTKWRPTGPRSKRPPLRLGNRSGNRAIRETVIFAA